MLSSKREVLKINHFISAVRVSGEKKARLREQLRKPRKIGVSMEREGK